MKRYQMASTIRNMSKQLPPSRTAPQFVVRFPDEEMRDRIKEAAEANNRSMNAEIIARLQDSFVAESEFHVGSKITHTPLDEDRLQEALEEASERGAQNAIAKVIDSAARSLQDTPAESQRSYAQYMVDVLLGLDKDGNPVDYNPPRTPAIPGVNAPKRGLGAAPRPDKPSKPKKQTMVTKRVFVDTPPDTTKK